MSKKTPSLITSITLDRATFHRECVEQLSFINFFYGNNGAGKSTLAYAISEAKYGGSVEWAQGCSPEDYDILVYNREFIDGNFSGYGDLKGVFTVNKTNIGIQKQLEAGMEEKKRLEEAYSTAQTQLQEKAAAQEACLTSFQNECWKRTVKERAELEKALEGKKTKKGFADAVLAEANPTGHDRGALKRLCDTAFDASSRTYPEFKRVSSASTYGTLPGKDLLDKVIVSSAETTFAGFMRKLGASDWVRRGHEHFTGGADGKCPYCQQKLPDTFKEDIRRCFDGQYEQDLSDIAAFRDTYERETGEIIRKLRGNMDDAMPSLDLSEYAARLELLASEAAANFAALAEKAREPSRVIALRDTDSLLLEIGGLIDEINQRIKANNDVVNAGRAGRAKCRKEAVEYMAFLLKSAVKDYKEEREALEAAIRELKEQERRIKKSIGDVLAELSGLNAQAVNTEGAFRSINKILRDSGFQGFSLREKKDVKNTYEVVREDGRVAENLSEGERSLIAFLYFYQLVRGSRSSKERKDRLVVLDDPVSGMDSASLFLVSSIVREMIDICRNNTQYKNPKVPGSYIKQIFILTHNVHFHKEITYRQTGYYDCASFYRISKNGNISGVRLCERPRRDAPGEKENYNPVQSSYEALWEELRDTDSVIPALNIMRRILEYYFLRLCGYEGGRLREELLEKEENKRKFITDVPGGEPDMTDYLLASKMLAYIGKPDGTGGLDFLEECGDVDACKRVFKHIFDALGHGKHYNMMTGADHA